MRRDGRLTWGVILGLSGVLAACQAQVPAPGPSATATTAPVASTGERFVSPAGDDAAAGTAEAPYRTMSHGLAQVRPGETLLVHAGTYRERITDVVLREGRADAPIRVRPRGDGAVTIQGLLWLRRPSYWSIDGLRVVWDEDNEADEHMVKITGGEHWSVTGLEAAGAKSYAGVLVVEDPRRPEHPAHWRLAGSCVHDTASANGRNEDQLVYVNTGLESGPGLVEGNLLFNAPNGAGVKLGGPDPDAGGAAGITVRFNTIVETEQSVMLAWRSTGNLIERNLFVGTGDGYAAIRGFELAHDDNTARANLAYATDGLFLNDPGYPAVQDGGGNVTDVDPQMTGDGCDGLQASSEAAEYGHTAAADTTTEDQP